MENWEKLGIEVVLERGAEVNPRSKMFALWLSVQSFPVTLAFLSSSQDCCWQIRRPLSARDTNALFTMRLTCGCSLGLDVSQNVFCCCWWCFFFFHCIFLSHIWQCSRVAPGPALKNHSWWRLGGMSQIQPRFSYVQHARQALDRLCYLSGWFLLGVGADGNSGGSNNCLFLFSCRWLNFCSVSSMSSTPWLLTEDQQSHLHCLVNKWICVNFTLWIEALQLLISFSSGGS